MIHDHKCPSAVCAHVWSHDDRDLRHLPKGDFNRTHSCPKCGREQFYRHFESEQQAEEWGKAHLKELQDRFNYLRDRVNSGEATDAEEDEHFSMMMELVFGI